MKKLSRRTFIKLGVSGAAMMACGSLLPGGKWLLPPAEAMPSQANAQTWKFAMISDTHDADMAHTKTGVTAYLAPIISYIAAEQPDFVLQTGDLITGAQTLPTSPACKKFAEQYANFKQVTAPLAQAKIPLYVVRGNHDFGLYDENKTQTQAYMADIAGAMPQNGPPEAKGLTYSFVHKKIKIIMLDQYVNAAKGVVTLPLKWLGSELANRQGAEYVFVMGHSPAYTPDITASSRLAQFNLFDQTALRDQFWRLLTDSQVTAYISGHEHLYFRGRVKGLPQIVIGNLGCNSSYNPATVDRQMTDVFPASAVPQAACRPGYSVFTVDGAKNSIAVTEYWLDQNNNKYVYDSYALSP